MKKKGKVGKKMKKCNKKTKKWKKKTLWITVVIYNALSVGKQ